jgi:predicted acyltransferase
LSTAAPRSPRLASIDALRGLTVAAMLLVNYPGSWSHVWAPLRHARWHGTTPTDFIFPWFLLIVGLSIGLAFGPKLDAGRTHDAALRRALLLRGMRIFVLGLVLNLATWLLLDTRGFRLMGVLQRIGICFACVGLIAIHLRNVRAQWALLAALLLGYWALLASGGPLEPGHNIADRVDNAVLGPLAYALDRSTGRYSDPEGLLSTLPAIGTTLLGLLASRWLRAGNTSRLWVAGVAAVAAGGAWSLALPLNKALWTPSYVLWTGGFGLLAVAGAHELIDRRGWPALGTSLGLNAITVYAGTWLLFCVLMALGVLQWLNQHLFSQPLAPLVGPEAASFAFAVAFLAPWCLLAVWARRRGWRITI